VHSLKLLMVHADVPETPDRNDPAMAQPCDLSTRSRLLQIGRIVGTTAQLPAKQVCCTAAAAYKPMYTSLQVCAGSGPFVATDMDPLPHLKPLFEACTKLQSPIPTLHRCHTSLHAPPCTNLDVLTAFL